MDPLKIEPDDDNLLEIMDETSSVSGDVMNERNTVLPSIKNEGSNKLNGQTVAYRLVMPSDVVAKHLLASNAVVSVSSGNAIANMSQQFYMISSESGLNDSVYVNSTPRTLTPIAPKVTNSVPIHPAIAVAPIKKRDDRRRATHNEVERRRRDKINHWIMKLGNIIPADGIPGGATDRPNVTCADGQSKGHILSQACEYVTALHSKVNELTETLVESEKAKAETERLRDSNNELRLENQQLRAILLKNGLLPHENVDSLLMLS